MNFIEGGIYTNKDDDIWICLFEKDSECELPPLTMHRKVS